MAMTEIILALEVLSAVALGVWLGRAYQRGCEADKRQAFVASSEFNALSYAEQRGAWIMWAWMARKP